MSVPRHLFKPHSDVLTAREAEVMAAFRKGESYKAIAQRLGISFCTVRADLLKARQKQAVSRSTPVANRELTTGAAARGSQSVADLCEQPTSEPLEKQYIFADSVARPGKKPHFTDINRRALLQNDAFRAQGELKQ